MSTKVTCGAGSPADEAKRNSRSLDYHQPTKVRHQRSSSASERLGLMDDKPGIFSIYRKFTPSRSSHKVATLPELKPEMKSSSKSRSSIGSALSSLKPATTVTQRSSTNAPVHHSTENTTTITTNTTSTTSNINNNINNNNNNHNNATTPHLLDQTGESKRSLPISLKNEINQFAIDGYAKKFFATHKKGLFRRRVPMYEMLKWTKDSINQPLLLSNKQFTKEALKCFKLIQILMGDRPKPRHFNDIEALQTLLECGITKGPLRDEIYVQICRQLNKNPKSDSIRKGWEIMCVISVTFPPSKDLESYLTRFVEQHHGITENQVDILSDYVSTKLVRICSRGARGKVLTAAEIERAKEAPFKPSVFGESLENIMDMQKESSLKVPQIVTFLANAVHDLNGQATQGIFRVPGDADAVTELRVRIENGNYDATGIDDPNVPASLLKYWLRDLAEPLIPTSFYDKCIKNAQDPVNVVDIINSLPNCNRRIALYMIRFLQDYNNPEVTQHTLMNVLNLAMVFAPNFLRCPIY
ncbi:Rho GTPase activation protein [Backusella circina FSU 941]|nr:Rho GTPase activation protein [Backusella circina FSU 941]